MSHILEDRALLALDRLLHQHLCGVIASGLYCISYEKTITGVTERT